MISSKMSSNIEINDIFEELTEENKRLFNELLFANKCIKTLITFKSFVDLISGKFKNYLKPNEWQTFDKLNKDIETHLPTLSLNGDQSKDIPHEGYRTSFSKNKKKNFINPKKYVCSFKGCGRSFAFTGAYNNHQLSHKIGGTQSSQTKTELIICPISDCKRARSIGRLRHHLMSIHSDCPFVCGVDACNLEFETIDEFMTHLPTHPLYGKLNNRYKKVYVCPLEDCGQELIGIKAYVKHRKSHKNLYKCEFEGCGYESQRKCHMTYHRNRHIYEPSICHICKNVYKSEYNLKEHIKRLHTQTGDHFVCDYEGCGLSFKNSSYLSSHRSRVHRHIGKKYKCGYEGCDKMFKTKKYATSHNRTVHSKEVVHCSWPGCDYTANCEEKLKTHVDVHNPEPKYVCDWPECGKAVRHESSFIYHMRSHYNDKRHVCVWPGCTFRTVTHQSLAKHRRTHRSELKPNESKLKPNRLSSL